MDKIEHITLFMADGTQRCRKDDYRPCLKCGGARFSLTSLVTGKLWNCYTCKCDKREEAAPKGHKNIISFAKYKAKKADVPEKG